MACTTQFVVVLDVSVVHVALPSVRHDLGFSAEGLQWVVTAYMLAFGGSLLLGGRLADLICQRRALLGGMALFATASLVAGLAWAPGVLIAARAVQGIGAAVLSPVSLTLLTSEFHDAKHRARALAAWGGVAAAAGAAGVFVGGLVTQYLNWRWTMLINVPIALLVLVLARGTVAGRARGSPPTIPAAPSCAARDWTAPPSRPRYSTVSAATALMFALGLLSWMYHRPTEGTETFLRSKFAKKPQ
ncbi:MFS transporter, partial [Streptomyces sp. NPDC056921]|uniref:MFS transporter n=1 Tax=Streptomyces sp. NPDC056921 TaxID=3345966 RepID=UPI00362E5CEF